MSETTKLLDPHSLKTFPGISCSAFQHPDDRKASLALQQLPLFPQILKALSGSVLERSQRAEKLSTSVRLGPHQGRQIYRLFVRAAEVLDLPELPEIYISNGAFNAYASGMKKYTVTLLSPLVATMNEAELLAIIGHELGHIKCAHMANKTLAGLLTTFGAQALASAVPVIGAVAIRSLEVPLAYWSRMAEFSCDRAALLVVQDPAIMANALGKISGWVPSVLGPLNFEALEEQFTEYESSDDNGFDTLFKIQNTLGSAYASHPMTALRIRRVMQWGSSDQFKEILAGSYPKSEQAVSADGKIHCLSCGQVISVDQEYCPTCGGRQLTEAGTLLCPNPQCHRPVKAGQLFCTHCGYDLRPVST